MENKITALEDDELEQVSGGTVVEMFYDVGELNSKGLLNKRYSKDYILNNFDQCREDIRNAWEKAGVRVESSIDGYNRYYSMDNQKQISRGAALSLMRRNLRH